MSIPPFEEIENGVHFRYWNCPSKFIPESVENFLMLYKYYKDFPSAPMPGIKDVSIRFFIAYRHYESKLNEFKIKIMETK